MIGHLEDIREKPVWQVVPEEIRAQFRGAMPAEPMGVAEVHEQFMNSILPYTATNSHPGFFGWVQGGGTQVGMRAEMLIAGLNANVGGRDQIPLDVERQLTERMRCLFGFPEGASGIVLTGSSMANFVAVILARDQHLGFRVRQTGVARASGTLAAYASSAVHGSVLKVLDLAGSGSDCLRMVEVDRHSRMDLDCLSRTIAEDRASGMHPFLVVGTARTIDLGAIDDVGGIARICAREQLWFHVVGSWVR